MKPHNLWIVFRKELLDISRDRRTLIFMILLPIVIMPGLMALMGKIVESGVERLRSDTSKVAVLGGERAPSMVRLLSGLSRAMDNPAFFAELADPTLAGGLIYMASPEETADAMLVAAAMRESLSGDDLGDARFLDVVDFEPTTVAGRRLFADGAPSFLADGARLRLLGATRTLHKRGALDKEVDLDDFDDPRLFADRQRLLMMSEAERAALDAELAEFEVLGAELAAALSVGGFNAIVIFHEGFQEALGDDGTARFTVLYDASSDKSDIARRKVTRFLDKLSTGIVRSRVLAHQLELGVLRPLASSQVNVGREKSILSAFLPYIVLIMCFLGAIFPAIDLGAGEKERGTLETLLVTPAGRVELVLGKFLVITLSALTAAMLNIASLTLSVRFGLLDAMGMSVIVFDPLAVVVSAVAMLPVAALFAALMLAVSIFAKSYKEAQSYTGPLQFVIIIPAVMSLMPGAELTIPLSLVPLVNVSLALKEAWAGVFQWDCIALLLISSLVYAAAMLVFCVKWFQREEVLFRA